jgi:hypothetical protein
VKKKEAREKENYANREFRSPLIKKGIGATLALGTIKLLHHKGKHQWESGGLQALPGGRMNAS